MYNPLSDLGRLASEVQDLERKLNNKVDDYEIDTIKNELSKITYQILSIENTLSYVQNDIIELKRKLELEITNG